MAAILLLVGNSSSLTTDDTALKNRLQTTLGHTVTVRNYSASVAVSGIDVAVIADSVSEGSGAYKGVSIPVVAFSDWLQMGLSANDNTSVTANTGIVVDDSGSPFAAGLSGTVAVYTGAQSPRSWFQAGWGGGMERVASSAATSSRIVLAFYDTGSTLQDGTSATGKRLVYGLRVPSAYTASGWSLFDAAVTELAPGTAATVTVPALSLSLSPVVGDVWSVTTLTAPVVSFALNVPTLALKAAAKAIAPSLGFDVGLDSPGVAASPPAFTVSALSLPLTLDDPVILVSAGIEVPDLDLSLDLDAPTSGGVITVAVPALSVAIGLDAPTLGSIQYWFRAPTRSIHVTGPLHRLATERGVSVLRVDGRYRLGHSGHQAEPESLVYGVDYFLGGHVAVPVSPEVAAQLRADGFEVYTENPD